jgi:hypothetical protein
MLPCVIASRQRLACMSCVHDTECNDLILVMQHFLNVEHMCWSLLCIMLFLFNDSRIWMQSFPCVSYCYLSTRALSQTDVTLKHRFHTNTLPYCFSIAALTRILSHTTRTTQTLYTRCYVFLVILCRCLGARVLSHTTRTTQTLYIRCYMFSWWFCVAALVPEYEATLHALPKHCTHVATHFCCSAPEVLLWKQIEY